MGSFHSVWMLAAWSPTVVADVMKGVSYGPVPVKSKVDESSVDSDDWFCDEAVSMWGAAGRADLANIQHLGANMIRLYGNDPRNDHTNFLDEALARGLSVAPGMSDYPYFQGEGHCQTTDFDCFAQVKETYVQNLKGGFRSRPESYHPALKYFNIINEPDLKMPKMVVLGSREEVYQMCRSIISAFDGILEAEKEAGVRENLINFTATFSFAVCTNCEFSRGFPGLSQMAQLDDAMHHPQKYGYLPKNNITAAYEARFTHSFNTANAAVEVKSLFLDPYENAFRNTPVYIGEYHKPHANQVDDLTTILGYAQDSALFLGISFFQYQVAYWKEDQEPGELDFGMFGLGDDVVTSMPYFSKTYDIYCLEEVRGLPGDVSQAYGGVGISKSSLCVANPLGVSLDQTGLMKIAAQKDASQMELFVERLIHHMGASVKNRTEFQIVAKRYSSTAKEGSFAELAGYIGGKPEWWIQTSLRARCLADRTVHPNVIGSAIGWVCSQGKVDCKDVPTECNSTYRLGDYLFSRFMNANGDASNPLVSCDFGGAAIYTPPEVYDHWTGSELCAQAAPATTEASTAPITTAGPSATTVSPTDPEATAAPTLAPSAGGTPQTTKKFMDRTTPQATSVESAAGPACSLAWHALLLCSVLLSTRA